MEMKMEFKMTDSSGAVDEKVFTMKMGKDCTGFVDNKDNKDKKGSAKDCGSVEAEVKEMQKTLDEEFNVRRKTLIDLDLFVLDNSLRETTVGQLRGHTLENKRKIYKQVEKVGFDSVIVESFNHQNRLGEPFIRELIKDGEDMSTKYAFSEMFDGIDPTTKELPVGLRKCKEFGIMNVIMEIDLNYFEIDYEKFTEEKICSMLRDRFRWIRSNLSPKSRIFVNLRDFSPCMLTVPERLFRIVNFISSLPPEERIFGLAYEEGGRNLPEQLAVWTATVRKLMNKCGWTDGHLIVHVHEQFAMVHTVQLECLANGATGIWAGLSREGAAMGHADSCTTILNLVRLGNTKVLAKFHCDKLREASREVTLATTGKYPEPMRSIVGDRALDVVFSFNFANKKLKAFNIAKFFGHKPTMRVSNMASPEMILTKLKNVFGDNPEFTLEIAEAMKEKMLEDLQNKVKEEYNSTAGLAMLYDRSGGQVTTEMTTVIENQIELTAKQEELLKDVRAIWDYYDIEEYKKEGKKDNQLHFDSFYDGFMAPHFGCYRCEDARKALWCIDMDEDGYVDWNEFAIYLKWAIRQYPDISSAEELITCAFEKGIKPAMQDEILKAEPQY